MIVLIALLLLLVSLPATILLIALSIAASGLAAAGEGTIVRPASPAGKGTLIAPESHPSATPDPEASAAA